MRGEAAHAEENYKNESFLTDEEPNFKENGAHSVILKSRGVYGLELQR